MSPWFLMALEQFSVFLFKLMDIVHQCLREPTSFYAVPAPGKNFDAAPVPGQT
jgi:hypothetical protein